MTTRPEKEQIPWQRVSINKGYRYCIPKEIIVFQAWQFFYEKKGGVEDFFNSRKRAETFCRILTGPLLHPIVFQAYHSMTY